MQSTSLRVDSTVAAATTSSSVTVDPSTTTTTVLDAGDVAGFSVAEITLDERRWTVAVADTAELRQRGLMFVEDLGDLDGMLFVFEVERAGGFWMKNTLIPLDIAFFDAAGALVEVLSMEPCEQDPCPTYTPSATYRYALEVPQGDLIGLPASARLEF